MITAPNMAAAGAGGWQAAIEQVAAGYAKAGRSAQGYVRGKLRWDPVFAQLAARVPFPCPVVDLGCGQAILLALLARLQPGVEAVGIEWDDRKLAAGSEGTSGLAGVTLVRGDVRDASIPEATTIFIIDVLHYLQPDEQSDLLRRAVRSLRPGGCLIVRDVDASAGVRAWINRWQERVNKLFGVHQGETLRFRTAAELERALQELGLDTKIEQSSGRLPLSNVLVTARRPEAPDGR